MKKLITKILLIFFIILITGCNTTTGVNLQEINTLNLLRPIRPTLIEKDDVNSLQINCIRLITCIREWENYAGAVDELINKVGEL